MTTTTLIEVVLGLAVAVVATAWAMNLLVTVLQFLMLFFVPDITGKESCDGRPN